MDHNFGKFKKWLSEDDNFSNFFDINRRDKESPKVIMEESEDSIEKYIGREAKTKVSKNKLIERIEIECDSDDILEDCVEEFIEEGGVISDVVDKKFHIETTNYEFIIPRACVKSRKRSN